MISLSLRERFGVRFGLLALLLSACALPPQTLGSPCVGQPVTDDAGSCPMCARDSDCVIVTNLCHPAASCVPNNGTWFTDLVGCDQEHSPTTATCGCVDSVCASK